MIICAIIIILCFVINKIIYKGAEVYFEGNHIRDSILFGMISIFLICTFVLLLLAKLILPFGVTNSFAIVDTPYEDLKIYKVLNSDVTYGHKKYGNACVISDEKGKFYYEFGGIDLNGETQARLNEIAEQYNIEIIEINSMEDMA